MPAYVEHIHVYHINKTHLRFSLCLEISDTWFVIHVHAINMQVCTRTSTYVPYKQEIETKKRKNSDIIDMA